MRVRKFASPQKLRGYPGFVYELALKLLGQSFCVLGPSFPLKGGLHKNWSLCIPEALIIFGS